MIALLDTKVLIRFLTHDKDTKYNMIGISTNSR